MEYKAIFSPLTVAGRTLKSRIFQSSCYEMEMEHGPDPHNRLTAEEMFARAERFYIMVARAGASIATIAGGGFPGSGNPHLKFSYFDPVMREGMEALLAAIHREGTLCVQAVGPEPSDHIFSRIPHPEELHFHGDYNPFRNDLPECTTEMLDQCVKDYGQQAFYLKELGLDGMSIHMSYQSSMLTHALSPIYNHRADKYGGKTLSERAQFPLAVLREIRQRCGEDFIIQLTMSPFEEKPGYTVEDWLEFLKLAEGLFDIVQVRGYDGSYTHVTSFNSSREEPANLPYARMAKERGIRGVIAPVGGFENPNVIERALEDGSMDAVFMARTFFAEPDYAEKLRAGHPEKIRPCLGCMPNCGFPSCAVNPLYGLILDPKLFPPLSKERKKVAVIGAGPAGIRAALYARHH